MVYGTMLTATCVGLLVVAAIHDLAARTIPNMLPLALLAAGIALRLGTGDLLPALAAASAVFVLAGMCWFRGWLGGGDVKLLGATALVLPVALIPAFILTVGLVGGLLALVYLLARCMVSAAVAPAAPVSLLRRAWRAECWRIRRGGPLPYAVAIAASGVLALLQGAPP
jgi:prepilin peptidase CpaA